jgi:hypothetical protein
MMNFGVSPEAPYFAETAAYNEEKIAPFPAGFKKKDLLKGKNSSKKTVRIKR